MNNEPHLSAYYKNNLQLTEELIDFNENSIENQ